MRIGFFADEFLPRLDGVIVSMLSSARGLRELGHEVYFIVPDYPGAKEDKFALRVPSSSVPLSDNVRLMRPSRRISQNIAHLQLDIIHSHTPLTAGLLARKAAEELDLPHIASFHTLLPVVIDYYPIRSKTLFMPSITALLSDILWQSNLSQYHPPASAGSSNAKRWAWRMTGAYADSADLVISPSWHYAKELSQLGIKTPVEVVPTGLDLSAFTSKRVGSARPLKVIAVGRLSEEKRQDVLIRAVASLPKGLIELTLVGDGPTRAKLENMARELGLSAVNFLGSVKPTDIPGLLRQADVGVLASHGFDTQCIALVEYMASGLPVLYCDANLREVVGPQAGLLTGHSVRSVAAGLKKLADEPGLRRALSRAGIDRSRNFSYQAMAQHLQDIYTQQLA